MMGLHVTARLTDLGNGRQANYPMDYEHIFPCVHTENNTSTSILCFLLPLVNKFHHWGRLPGRCG